MLPGCDAFFDLLRSVGSGAGMAELHPPGAGGYKISRGGVHVSLTRTRGPDDTPNAWGLSRSGGAGKDLARALAQATI
jgi:hypothetical protein